MFRRLGLEIISTLGFGVGSFFAACWVQDKWGLFSAVSQNLPLNRILEALVALAVLIALTAFFSLRHFQQFKKQSAAQIEAERRIQSLAYYDQLTGLPNRTLLLDRLDHALAQAKRERRTLAVFFLDLDWFKKVNDSLGHPSGDVLLQTATRRLKPYVRKSDTLGRLGGDEFLLILNHAKRHQDVTTFAQRFINLLNEPFKIKGHQVSCTGSIGIALYPADGSTSEALMKKADTAMYRAKDKGRNQFQYFQKQIDVEAMDRVRIESDLRSALTAPKGLVFHWQPQASLRHGGIVGIEALARWNHPQEGLIPPDRFIPVAEDSGLIIPFGELMLEKACRYGRELIQAGLSRIRIGVNVSVKQILHSDFPSTVQLILQKTRLPAKALELEITETVLVKEPEKMAATLTKLSRLGVSLAIDDFGAGFSSLNYLQRYRFNRIKIDGSFVRNLTTCQKSEKIVRGVIAMGRELGVEVLAEGVETQEQLNFLVDNNCQSIQGFHFAVPMPALELNQRLKQGLQLDLSLARGLAGPQEAIPLGYAQSPHPL